MKPLSQLVPVLNHWLSQFKLPDMSAPDYQMEEADLDILRGFFALLLVSSEEPPSDPVSAVRAYLPDFPDFPVQALPSDALVVLGVARPSGPTVQLQKQLTAKLDAQQAAAYMILAGEA